MADEPNVAPEDDGGDTQHEPDAAPGRGEAEETSGFLDSMLDSSDYTASIFDTEGYAFDEADNVEPVEDVAAAEQVLADADENPVADETGDENTTPADIASVAAAEAATDLPAGSELGEADLEAPAAFTVADDEAEELAGADTETPDDTPDKADPSELEVDDEGQLDEATEAAAKAASARPVKRKLTTAPVKKSAATPSREQQTKKPESKRTGPVTYVKQSVGELKKVVWPSGDDVRQYFVVVLIFVVVIMGIVAGLDVLFGWGLMKWLG